MRSDCISLHWNLCARHHHVRLLAYLWPALTGTIMALGPFLLSLSQTHTHTHTHTQTAFACFLSLCSPPSFAQGFTMLYVRAGDLGQYVPAAYMSDCYASCGAHAHSACFAASSAVGFYTCSCAIIKCKVGTEFESAHKHPLSVCHIPTPRSS